ncbi:hypothetical protein OlV7_178c [Ostreococcus lucimarinus virus 7]|jgi:hypothetical protein|uniref:hypothetical protein n=1 Tax=Ostreococcus lucimarinus virus 7 TaxID=1663209 RepID=UPI0006D24335|nr:hypothetical protein AP054_gp230 [Ostreococcus lucimarinus virus 7]ALI95810.1 hypothetical protein OlV7_178c [Ostreococcus lucimarinus virus 7]QBP06870.1 hypothetical protein OlV7_gene176 [Ostreococcus lucimarinus virus 7]
MFIYYKMNQENFDDQMIKQQALENRRDSWNEQHESILRQWGEASGCYRYMHHRAFLLYKGLSMRFTLPVIILSTITGTANFAQEQFPENLRGMVPSVIGGLNLIAGLVATIMQFLKINELMENHKAAALSFGLLSRNIRLELALAREERSTDGLEFVTRCKNEYDRLIEQSPSVPSTILAEFEKEYPLDNMFTKPEILDVRAIPKLKLPGFTNIRSHTGSSVISESTKGGPLSRIGELVKGREEYEAKIKILEEMQSELDEEEELTSVVSEEPIDVEQGTQEE